MTQAEALAALSDHAEERAGADEFSGAVLVARHGKVLLQDAWGRADRKSGTANKRLDLHINYDQADRVLTADVQTSARIWIASPESVSSISDRGYFLHPPTPGE
jgi:hypothetical protein